MDYPFEFYFPLYTGTIGGSWLRTVLKSDELTQQEATKLEKAHIVARLEPMNSAPRVLSNAGSLKPVPGIRDAIVAWG